MRRVELDALVPGASPEAVYAAVTAFARYPELAPHVQSTVVHHGRPEPTGSSSWELHFRSGLLRWTEQERFDEAGGVVEFSQERGDFDEFGGRWSVSPEPGGTRVRFVADFDFGIPSLEGILDPIAERVIRETAAFVVVGNFPAAQLETPLSPDGSRPPAPAGATPRGE
jgi:ribosome-associated toxin RatA of RatAB toxin-antitoxin module